MKWFKDTRGRIWIESKNKTKWILVGTLAAAAISGIALLPGGEVTPPVDRVEDSATYFAEIDENNVVIRLIVADQAFIDSGLVGDPNNWIQTFLEGEGRKNYAGVGYTYDETRNAFITDKPSPNATFDEDTARWVVPPKVITASST